MTKKLRSAPRENISFTSSLMMAVADMRGKSDELKKIFTHRGITWDERAANLKTFLERVLPGRFGVTKGEAIDYKWNRTPQLDLVIYDKIFSPPIFAWDEWNLLLPIESVYVVIESKTTLEKKDCKQVVDMANRLKAMLPFQKRFQKNGSKKPGESTWSRCLCSLFAVDSSIGEKDWAQKEFERLMEQGNDANTNLDSILVLEKWLLLPSEKKYKIYSWEAERAFIDWYLSIQNFLLRESKRRKPTDMQIYSYQSGREWFEIK